MEVWLVPTKHNHHGLNAKEILRVFVLLFIIQWKETWKLKVISSRNPHTPKKPQKAKLNKQKNPKQTHQHKKPNNPKLFTIFLLISDELEEMLRQSIEVK